MRDPVSHGTTTATPVSVPVAGSGGGAPAPSEITATGSLRALVEACRPRQWIKNLLVLAAPAAAGVLHEPAVLGRLGVLVGAFCLAASSTYLVNDVRDREADRHHPRKRFRPVAAGLVSPRLAVVTAVALAVAGAVAAAALSPVVLAVVAGYVALTAAYSLRLKHLPVVDIGVIAAGFVLRVAAGAAAAEVPMSRWFLVVVSFGALLVASGKRFAEATALADGASHRSTLAAYTPAFLRHVTHSSGTVAILAYCVWAFDGVGADTLWHALSVGPFALAILHYSLLLESGRGGEPEEIALRDRTMHVLGLVWVVLLTIGVYSA